MKSKPAVNQKEKVDALMARLEHPFKAEIEAVRAIILAAGKELYERVKWNAPSFFYNEVDFAAFNLHQQSFLQLILLFPKVVVSDPAGIMEGDWKDRRQMKFYSMDDVTQKKKALEKIVKEWIKSNV